MVTRDFISISSLTHAIDLLISRNEKFGHREVFNISSGRSLTLTQLSNLIEEILEMKIQYKAIVPPADLIINSSISREKLESFCPGLTNNEEDHLRSFVQNSWKNLG
jgi:nucleoside-diphosphate-sugar epimerase